MSPNTIIYAAIVAPTAALVITAIAAGLIVDRHIDDEAEPEPDIATQVAHEDGYAAPPAVVPVHHRHRGAHARGRSAA